jgi:hypothetical protein
MYSTVLVIALNGTCLGVEADQTTVRWQPDYAIACGKGRETSKPLAVFFGPGPEGWRKPAREGGLSEEILELLRTEYVAVHVDTSRQAGKARAAQFELPDGVGLVISDRSGGVQAFHHVGQLASADLSRYLRRYAAEGHNVTTTETVHRQAAAYAPPVVYSFGNC